jgi:predicted TIM-barrel fold metal-dependent hydrolase
MIVKVYPTQDNRWGLFLIDEDKTFLVGASKHSFDVDLAAERMGKALRGLVEDPSQIVVDHCAADRAEIMAYHEAAKKEGKKK